MSFFSYIVRRLLTLIPLLIIMSVITYILILQGGGGLIRLYSLQQINIERALLEVELGLDRSPVINYFLWLGEVMKGNIGVIDDRVGGETGLYSFVLERLGKSLSLISGGMIISLLIGLPLGIFGALFPKSLMGKFIYGFISFGITVPNFILGFFLIYIFAVRLKFFPVGGFEGMEAGLGDLKGLFLLFDRLKHLFLPSLTLGLPAGALLTNQVMNGIVETVNMHYIRTAHAKGLSFMRVVLKHLLPNSLSAMMAGFFALIPHFIGWLVIVEVIFSWPGLAYFAFNQGLKGDYYVILIVLIFTALLTLGGGILADIIHALMDPRVRDLEQDTHSKVFKGSGRLFVFVGLALFFSILYYPLQSFLLILPLVTINSLVALLLLLYSLSMMLKGGCMKGDQVSLSGRGFFFKLKEWLSIFWKGRNTSLLVGLLLFFMVIFLIFWPFDYSFLVDEMDSRTFIRYQRQPPSFTFLLGTDEKAHDVLLKTLYHGKETLYLGLKMLFIAIIVGGSFGLLAGYIGGGFDFFINYLVQLSSSFPVYFLVMLALPFIGSDPRGMTLLLGLVGSLQIFKVIRMRTISLVKQEFVEGAYALGVSQLGLMKDYLIPNILPFILSEGSLIFGQLIVYLSALGFLGFIPWGGWGQQMAQGRYYEWWIKLGPSLALMITVFSLYLLGKGVLQAIDPFYSPNK